MSLSLVIIINLLADTALIGGLAYVMSRASHLTPHVLEAEQAQSPAPRERAATRRRSRSGALRAAYSQHD